MDIMPDAFFEMVAACVEREDWSADERHAALTTMATTMFDVIVRYGQAMDLDMHVVFVDFVYWDPDSPTPNEDADDMPPRRAIQGGVVGGPTIESLKEKLQATEDDSDEERWFAAALYRTVLEARTSILQESAKQMGGEAEVLTADELRRQFGPRQPGRQRRHNRRP